MKNNVIYYSVGALLYCPANKRTIADAIIEEKFGSRFSLALCLEDTIHDDFVEEAESILIDSIKKIYNASQTRSFYLPKIFVRVRSSEQIIRLTRSFGESGRIVMGYIIPKFSAANSGGYIQAVIKANEMASHKIYMMPIYESASIISLKNRIGLLYELKEELSQIEELVLNIRVGGNDLCHLFGFRRHADESIYHILPIAHIFSDICTIYGSDYVISGPVWEYYSGDNWRQGLLQEIADDKLCGFTGKTVIHPNQIEVVNQAYRVTQTDYHDAMAILNWNKDLHSFVSGNVIKERMNECKTHYNWAQKTLFLAEAFGVESCPA